MKPSNTSALLRFIRRQSSWLLTASLALALASPGGAQAATLTWSGATDGTWATGTNWAGTAPVNGDDLIFTGTSNTSTNNDIVGLTLGGTNAITFNNSTTGGVFTLAGNSVILGGNITTTGTTGTPTHTISLDMQLNGNRTVTAITDNNINISGVISDDGGARSLTKAGAGTLTLSGTNSFTGDLIINAGTATVNSIAAAGTNSAIGAGSGIQLGSGTTNGTLTYTGGAATLSRNMSLASSSSGGGTLNSNGTGPLTVTGTLGTNHTGSKTFTIGGTNAGANDFQSVISNGTGGGTITVAKAGNGTWTLSAANTFSGALNVNAGTLKVSSIADSGSSNIGIGTGLIRVGNAGSNGTLEYTGAANATTNRQIRVGGGTGSGDTGGGTISNTGTGTLTFTNTAFNSPQGGTFTAARTLTLGGTNTGANTINGAIVNNNSSGANVNLAKNESGRWILAGNNTYSGTTTLSGGGGVLQLDSANALPGGIGVSGGTSALTISNNAILGLGAGDFTRGLGSGVTQVRITTGGGFAAYNADRIVNLGGAGAGVQWGSTDFLSSGNFQLSSGTATHTVNFQNPIDLNSSGGTRTIVTRNGSAVVDAVISGALTNTAGNATLLKQDAGTLRLEGTNVLNAGPTTIQNGTLIVASGSSIGTGLLTLNSNGGATTAELQQTNQTLAGITLGSNSALADSTVTLAAGTAVLLTGNVTYTDSTTVANTAIISGGTLDITGADRTFTVNDNSMITGAELTISSVVTGSNAFIKGQSGTLALTGTNTYAGQTRINSGTVEVNTLANEGSASSLGTGDNAATSDIIRIGNVANTGTLNYIGTGNSTDRRIQVGSDTTAASTGGATVLNNGSGALTFTNATFNSPVASGTGTDGTNTARTLTLGGSNTGANTIQGVIANNTETETPVVNLVKQDAGHWTLSGANTYTGTTTVSGGSLQVGSSGTGKTGSGDVTVQSGGTILGTGVIRGTNVSFVSGAMVHTGDGTAQSNYGTLSFTPVSGSGNFDFQSGSSVILGINPGGSGDLLSFDGLSGGTLNFNGNLSVTASGYVPAGMDVFNLLDWTNLSTVNFDSRFSVGSYGGFLLGNGDDNLGFDLPDISGSGYAWDISNFTTNGTIVTVVVPEPSRALLLLIGACGLLARRRRC